MASQDPYFEVASECEASLISLSSQLASFQRLSHSAPTDQLAWSLSELKATLVSLENDLEELEESVRAVEEPGVARRLGIRDLEVKGRREFVQRVKSEIDVSSCLATSAWAIADLFYRQLEEPWDPMHRLQCVAVGFSL